MRLKFKLKIIHLLCSNFHATLSTSLEINENAAENTYFSLDYFSEPIVEPICENLKNSH